MRKGSKNYTYSLKAKESMLAAVEIFNSPLITFKSETTITLICTAWTYILQAYCLKKGIEIRAKEQKGSRRKFARSHEGEILTIPLPELINKSSQIINEPVKENLLFLIGIRNRIQHDVRNQIDSLVAPKIQTNIMSFRDVLATTTDSAITIENELPFALQFTELSCQQTKELLTSKNVSNQIRTFILNFEEGLSREIKQHRNYQARVKLQVVNCERGEDLKYVKVLGIGKNPPSKGSTTYLKEVEKEKYTPTEVIKIMND